MIKERSGKRQQEGQVPWFQVRKEILIISILMTLFFSLSIVLKVEAAIDAFFANFGQPNSVCRGDGLGGFACSDVSTDTSPASFDVALGDINGDNNLDAVYGIGYGVSNRVCLGDGSGGFACSNVITDDEYNIKYGVALGYVNGDSNLDAVFANWGKNRVCLGDGLGGFTCSDISSDSNYSSGVALGFINGDNNLDAVFANQGIGERNQVCFGDGTGGFACSDVSTDTSPASFDVALGDINGDNNLDAVFARSSGSNLVCLGDGSGGFACSNLSTSGEQSFGVALGYVDGDNNLDAVFANAYEHNRVCLGNGLGGFTCSDVSTDTNSSENVALGYIDGDSNLDAVFAVSGINRVCLGNGLGGFTCSDVSSDSNYSRAVALSIDTSPRIMTVNINIKPGDYPNRINPTSKGSIPVAILTTKDFDATTIDPLSVKFGPDGAMEEHRKGHRKGHIEDVDKDGDLDLVLHFKTQETGIECGDIEAGLTGKTFDGQLIEGFDSITTVKCNKKKKL